MAIMESNERYLGFIGVFNNKQYVNFGPYAVI